MPFTRHTWHFGPWDFWFLTSPYQLAFFTPGNFPSLDRVLKQILQSLNLRYTALDLPQSWQRVYCLTRNFGFFLALFSRALVDIRTLLFSFPIPYADEPLNGIPKSASNLIASSLVFAEVTKVMFIPCCASTFAGLISGNTVCSANPIA